MNPKAIPAIRVNNGVDMPALGYGVAALEKGTVLNRAIDTALAEDYRLFDNAPFYGNEAEVGAALRGSGVPRKELYISTKLPNTCHAYEDTLKAFDLSLKTMGLDYFDMYLIHFPMPLRGLFCEAWRAMERLYRDGLVRVIGVSNFQEHHLQKVLDCCEIRPMTNELECNPYYTISPLRRYCADKDIRVINWFPLGGPREPLLPYPVKEYKVLLDDVLLKTIGKKYGKTTAQIALRWAIDCGMVPIPKSASPERIRENRRIFDFRLTEEEREQISALNHDRRFGPDSDVFNEDQG